MTVARTFETLALDTTLIAILNGDGFASPMAGVTQRLALGDLLVDAGDRLAVLESSVPPTVDTISEDTAGHGVIVDGLRLKDAAINPVAGGAAWCDLSNCATGEADTILGDNLASAWELREGANTYVACDTRNDRERVQLGKLLADPAIVTIDMNDATHTLVYGAAGAAQTKVTSRILFVDANSSGTEKLLLPPEATSAGIVLQVFNSGGESIVVRDDGDGTTILTIPTAKAGLVACDGVTWRGLLGA